LDLVLFGSNTKGYRLESAIVNSAYKDALSARLRHPTYCNADCFAPAMAAQGIARGANQHRRGRKPFMQAIGKALGQSLDQATYAGYRLGFEAAREEAALLAELAGQGALAAQLRAMRPLPDKSNAH
jgi:hypothetical protein